VTLFGQNVNVYRVKMIGDASGMSTEMADFATLLEYVVDRSGIERIRYATSHFNEFAPPTDRSSRHDLKT